MQLDEQYTYQVAFKGRYYYYSYIDGTLRLVRIRDIEQSEISNLFNACANNEKFIDDNFGTEKDDKDTTSKGKKK
jgi:hypothetical protein